MNALAVDDVDRSRKWRRYRRHEDREPSIIYFFDDECGHQRIFDLDERRLPRSLFGLSCHALRKTPDERVARDPFEQGPVETRARCATGRSSERKSDEKTDEQDE